MRIRVFILSILITGSIFDKDFSGRATYKTNRKSASKLDSTKHGNKSRYSRTNGGSNDNNV